jgi:hypothetical protein
LVQFGAWKATLELKAMADLSPAEWNPSFQPLEFFERELRLELTALSQGPWHVPYGTSCLPGTEKRKAEGSQHENDGRSVVSLDKNVAVPLAPKAVCDPPPPKAPAKSAPLPDQQHDQDQQQTNDNVHNGQ